MRTRNKISVIVIILAVVAALALFGLFYFSGNDYGAYPFLVRPGPAKQ